MPNGLTAELLTRITGLCHDLNAAGFEPQWRPSLLASYVNTKFRVREGLNSLTFAQAEDLIEDLEARLREQRAFNEANERMATPAARSAIERAALAAGGGTP